MFTYSLFFSLLCITSALGANLIENVHTTNNTNVGAMDKKNITIASEGGTILLSSKQDTTLPNENFNSLVSLDEEFRKTKQKSVVPRKGVGNIMPPDIAPDLKNSSHIDTENKTAPSTPQKVNNTPKGTKVKSALDAAPQINPTNSSDNVQPTKPVDIEQKKKPLILSYAALASMPVDQSKFVAPSTKTMSNSQIPSPNGDIPKVYPSKANSHPGMIMPIVITILVVPMFAIVGYMALKRGQEAWKNRHYKRMDFLLDGMYND